MKTKLIVGSVLAVFLLVIGQYFFLPSWYRELGVKTSGWLIMLSVAAGIALRVLLMVYVINKLLSGQPINLFGLGAKAPTGSKIGSYPSRSRRCRRHSGYRSRRVPRYRPHWGAPSHQL